jgi:hypothetical protein
VLTVDKTPPRVFMRAQLTACMSNATSQLSRTTRSLSFANSRRMGRHCHEIYKKEIDVRPPSETTWRSRRDSTIRLSPIQHCSHLVGGNAAEGLGTFVAHHRALAWVTQALIANVIHFEMRSGQGACHDGSDSRVTCMLTTDSPSMAAGFCI